MKKYMKGKYQDTIFHIAVGPVMIFGNLLGILPVSGLLATDAVRVKFKWFAPKTILSVCMIIFGIVELVAAAFRIYESGFKLYVIAPMGFYIIGEIGLIMYFRIAMRWPEIIQKWRDTEEHFLNNAYMMHIKSNMKFKIRIVALCFLTFGIGEHILYMVGVFTNSKLQVEKCNSSYDVVENMYRSERPIFDLIGFHIWLVPFSAWLLLSMALCWTFIDILISVSSISIAAKFNLITERIRMAKEKMMLESFWQEIRKHYGEQSKFVLYLDKHYSSIILHTCGNGVFFICVKLFRMAVERRTMIDYVFSWYSLIFFIGRTLGMLFFASTVYDSSKKPLELLRDVPTKYWSLELHRFANDINQYEVAFSGKKFFFLTRRLIFGMIGTVVTYEIFLLDRRDSNVVKDFCEINAISL